MNISMITFRKATIKDKEQVAYLVTLLHEDLSLDEALNEYDYFLERGVFFVVCVDDKIIAFVHGAIRTEYIEGSEQYKNPKVGYIESLFVLPQYRKQGIAKRLCTMLEKWAKNQGANEFASDAYADNKESIAFHESIGLTASPPIIHFIKKLK